MKFAIFRRHRPLAFNGTFREGKQPFPVILTISKNQVKTPLMANNRSLCPTGSGCKDFFTKSYSGDIPF
jgi:hypothetical protein